MTAIYSTGVTAVRGRSGTVRSDDGLLDLKLVPPKAIGGVIAGVDQATAQEIVREVHEASPVRMR